MAEDRSGHDHKVETLECPVCGAKVTFSTTFRSEDGVTSLVDFECDREGDCGITAWDPCPMYIKYLEKKSSDEA